MKTISDPSMASQIFSVSSAAARRPTSGFAPAPRPFVSASPIWILFRAPFLQSAWTSVFMVTNFTPCSPASIMRLTAFPPPPPTPTTVMRAGLEASSANVAIRLPNIVFLLLARLCC
jgi:hypothetical protein